MRRAKNEKAFWRKERRRAARERDRKLLQELRAALRNAKALRLGRLREVTTACQRTRLFLREKAKAVRAAARAAAQAEIDRDRQQSRSVCELAKQRARDESRPGVESALRALEAERTHQAELGRWGKRKPLAAAGSCSVRRSSALQESDSEVESNLPSDLIGVWRSVKRRIKGTPNATRTEKFLEWAEEHRPEVLRLQDQQLERDVAELVRREQELREQFEDRSHYSKLTDAELEAVPF